MFVAPHNEVHPLRDHALVYTILGASTQVSILVEGENIEEFSFSRFLKSNLFALPHAVQTFVSKSPHSIEGDLCFTLFEEHR
jgi:hypothetical protein